mgnify:FL=1
MNYKLSNFKKIINEEGYDNKLYTLITNLYQYMLEKEWIGACHATVSALYVILKEEGYSPEICIGEVKKDNFIFDHSWLILDKKIIDLAISMTLIDGIPMNAPVIFDIDVDTLTKNKMIYGVKGNGLDWQALAVINSTFNDYMDSFPFNKKGLWGVVEEILRHDIDINILKEKYNNTKRKLINDK